MGGEISDNELLYPDNHITQGRHESDGALRLAARIGQRRGGNTKDTKAGKLPGHR